MNYISCKSCNGTGFIKRKKKEYCSNNPDKLSSHLCHKCENRQEKLKGLYKLCSKCYGDGYFIQSPKTPQFTC